MHEKTENNAANIFLTLPLEILYQQFDGIPLSSLTNLYRVDRALKNIVGEYLKNELQIKQIACGQNHTLILLKNGRVFATGSNKYGQLGVSDTNCFYLTEITGIDRIQAISAGFNHSMMLSKEKEVWVMGDNSKNQLLFLEKIAAEGKENSPEEPRTEAENSPKPVPLQKISGLDKIQAITTVDFTTAVLTTDGTVHSYGNDKLKPHLINNQLRLLPDWISLPKDLDIADVSFANSPHALLLTTKGELYGIGNNELGQLGLEKTEDCPTWTKLCDHQVSKIKATSLGSIILTAAHKLMVSGFNANRQFGKAVEMIAGFEEIATDVSDFDANDSHTIYLDTSNRLHGMGCNDLGQLGTGNPKALAGSTPAPLIPVQQLTVSKANLIQSRTPKVNQSFFQFLPQLSRIEEVEWEEREHIKWEEGNLDKDRKDTKWEEDDWDQASLQLF